MTEKGRAALAEFTRFDPRFYRGLYPDLRFMDDVAANGHFDEFGVVEGRTGSSVSARRGLLERAEAEPTLLEIGPFVRPLLVGDHVRYFDVLDQDALLKRAGEVGMAVETSVPIDFVHPAGDLTVVDERFDAVISSHAIEHQPDLIAHLRTVDSLLAPDGRYYLIVPDKRYCFDALLPESTVADVVEAHINAHDRHTLRNVIEHRALTTHNDAVAHWEGNPGQLEPDQIADRTAAALQEFEEANGSYIDVHAWKFTPRSFLEVIGALSAVGFVNLEVAFVGETPRNANEFTAMLVKRAAES